MTLRVFLIMARAFLLFFFILLTPLLLLSNVVVVAQNIIKTLPGFFGDLPFKFETGYIGIDEVDEVQLFYYFVESERNPRVDPLLLWLTGGPGCSGLSSLVIEIGPLSFDDKIGDGNKPTLVLNPHSWTKVANIIFLDAPVGTGFSYATNAEAYKTTSTIWATQAYEFLKKWLKNHPQFVANPLYIAGDSYAGLVVPIVTQKVSIGNDGGLDPLMNLKGYSIGNPVTIIDSLNQYRIPFAHRLALISDELYESTKTWCHGDYVNVDPNNTHCLDNLRHIMEYTERICIEQVLEPRCTLASPRQTVPRWVWDGIPLEHDIPNLLRLWPPQPSEPWCRSMNYIPVAIWANDKSVREALHVREGTIKDWARCNASLSYINDVTSNMDYHRYLMEKGYRALVYSGDHDMVVPYLDTLAWINSLNLSVTIDWRPWFVEGQVAGFTMTYSYNNDKLNSLTFATLKGAGHTGAEYKPREGLAMVFRWYAYYEL